MRKLWIGLGVVALLVFLYVTALPGDLPAGRDGESRFGGTYVVNGIDPTGVEYSGTAVLVATDDDGVYDVEWIVTGSIQRGVGRETGDGLVVDWVTVASAVDGGTARSVYDVAANGRLVGERTVDGVDEVGTEELIPEP